MVNFSATETFISDKRPFFTENQGLFEYTTPSDFSQLLYTRRVGAPADDGNGAGDITAAVKLNGSFGATKYGMFAADEADEVGRSFRALRLVRDFSKQNLGMMLTQVERPYPRSRRHGARHRPQLAAERSAGTCRRACSAAMSSNPATARATSARRYGPITRWTAAGASSGSRCTSATTCRSTMPATCRATAPTICTGKLQRRFTDLPEDSRYASKDWRGRVSTNYNNHGEKLNDQFRLSREGRLRNGSYEYAQININSAGVDDLLTRGNGSLKRPANFNAFFEYERPRKGNWAHDLEAEVLSGRLGGQRQDRLQPAL